MTGYNIVHPAPPQQDLYYFLFIKFEFHKTLRLVMMLAGLTDQQRILLDGG